jgi:hypothetical protein
LKAVEQACKKRGNAHPLRTGGPVIYCQF